MARSALVVRGGWQGHQPIETTDLFIPFLRDNGFTVRIEDDPAVYGDADGMREVDLIVQSVTMGEISSEACLGLRRAVERGAGLIGWHGGIVDSYRASAEYLQLVGGQFAAHPSKLDEGRYTRFAEFLRDVGLINEEQPIATLAIELEGR